MFYIVYYSYYTETLIFIYNRTITEEQGSSRTRLFLIHNVPKYVEGTSGKIAEVQVMFFSRLAGTSLSLYQIYTIYEPSPIKT